MKLVALPEKSGQANIHHFNFANEDGSMRHITVGSEPVEVPEPDAKTILRMDPQIGVHQDPEPKTRRGKEAAVEG